MDTQKALIAAGSIISILGSIGFIGIVWLLIYGNLSGNLGFTSGTQGYNDTEVVINNLTSGYRTFFGFSPTFFIIAAIVLLVTMFVGLIALAVGIVRLTMKSGGSKGNFSGY